MFELPCPGLRRVYVGICLLVCIINLLMAPVANVLMRLGCQGKGTKNFSRQSDFFNPGNYHCEGADLWSLILNLGYNIRYNIFLHKFNA